MTSTHLWRIDARAMWYSRHGQRAWTVLEIGLGVSPVAPGHAAGVVWTTDGWLTENNTAAVWEGNAPNPYGGQDELWRVKLEVGPTASLVRFTYALYVEDAKGQRHWDNNHGQNYEQIV